MNNKKKAFIIFLLLLGLIFILSSCGIKGSDTIKIDDNFKGERSFEIDFDKDTLKEVVDGKDGVKNFLKKNIEKPLNYSILEEKDDFLKIKLGFSFSNMEEYKKIVSDLYEKGEVEDDLIVEFNSSDQPPFARGMKFRDNTTVDTLFNYLDKKALDSKIIKDSSIKSIFKQSDINYNVVLNDEEIISSNSGDKIYDESDYLGPYAYFVVTSPSDKNKNNFNRKFNLIFNKESFYKLTNDWQKHFDKKIKFSDKVDKDGDVIISANLEDASLNTLNDISSKIFDTKSNFSFTAKESIKDLAKKVSIQDEIKNTNLNYDISGAYFYEPHKISDLNYTNIDEFLEKNAEDIDKDKAFFASSLEYVKHSYKEPYVFNKLNITTEIKGEEDIKRTLTFEIEDEVQKNLINETLAKYLDEKSIKYENNDKELIISYDGDLFNNENLKLFNQNPSIDYYDDGIFKYHIRYSENSSLKDIRVEEVKNDIKSPFLSHLNPESGSIEDSYDKIGSIVSLATDLTFDGIKLSSIIIPIILLALVIILVILIKKKKINFNYNKTPDYNLNQTNNINDDSTLSKANNLSDKKGFTSSEELSGSDGLSNASGLSDDIDFIDNIL